MFNILRRRRNAAQATTSAHSAPVATPTAEKAKAEEATITEGLKDTLLDPTPPKAPPTASPHADLVREKSEIARLWIRSKCRCHPKRDHPGDTLCPKLSPLPKDDDEYLHRMTNTESLAIALRLWKLLLPRVWKILWEGHELSAAFWLGRHILAGILPAYSLWAQSQLLDLTQQALTSDAVELKLVLRAALLSWLLQSVNDVYRIIAEQNDRSLEISINDAIETTHLSNQLSLPVSMLDDPYLQPLMYEAGVFAGMNFHYDAANRRWHHWEPFASLASLVQMLSDLVSLSMQVLLVIRTTREVSSVIFSLQSLGLLVLAIAPVGCMSIARWLESRTETGWQEALAIPEFLDNSEIQWMASSRTIKQDIALFGLKDWLLQQWTTMKIAERKARDAKHGPFGLFALLLNTLVEYGLKDIFSVLLAAGLLSTQLPLGSIQLYRSAASSIYTGFHPLVRHASHAYQMIFHMAAFVEAVSIMEDRDRRSWRRDSVSPDTSAVDYDTVRTGTGMRIEARDLAFAYRGGKQVLSNINLVVEPGETLALIGSNGEGKTTLIKVLMGLYSHTGTLMVNGRSIEEYDLSSVHRRTSCLFQDFRTYDMTVSHNIGLGDIGSINDSDKVERARVQGGVSDDNMKSTLKWTTESAPDETPVSGNDGNVADMGTENDGLWYGIRRRIVAMIRMAVWSLFRRAKSTITRITKTTKLRRPDYPSLSGGEQQRVALARAFMRVDNEDLIVFDEPSANLDPEAEEALFERIHSLSSASERKITTIFISHRVWTVRKADRIAVLDKGTISECGTHAELMKLGGKYHRLYTMSRNRFEPEQIEGPTASDPLAPISDAWSMVPTPRSLIAAQGDALPGLRKIRSCVQF